MFPTPGPTVSFEPTLDILAYPPLNCTGEKTLISGEYLLVGEALCARDYRFGLNEFGVLGLWKAFHYMHPDNMDEWGNKPWYRPLWIATTDDGIEALGYGVAVDDTSTKGFLLMYDELDVLQWFLYCDGVYGEDQFKLRLKWSDPTAVITLKKKGDDNAQELLIIDSEGNEFLDDRCFFPFRN